jgi:hypothetical protein
MTDDTPLTRRTVLRTTAATAVGAVAAAGTASASHFSGGETVCFTLAYQSYVEACPNDGYADEFEEGDEGTVYDTCRTDGGAQMLYVYEDGGDRDRGWVDHAVVERC